MGKYINIAPLIEKPDRINVLTGSKRMHEHLRAPSDFANRDYLKKCALPSLSDFVYPVLQDCDPTQEVEDEYRNKHDLLFSWRMLKQIQYVDIANFSRSKQAQCEVQQADKKKKPSNFEGDIEE